MYQLSLSEKYPMKNYNLLGNTAVAVDIPDIKSPVIQKIELNPNPKIGDVYIQQKGKGAYTDRNGNHHPAVEELYAITKRGLGRLADGAGITMVSSEHVIPTTCQKCVAVNAGAGRVIQCGNCNNKDVAYRVTIAVPQLTGEVIHISDTHEIIVDNVIPSMTEKQRQEFMKHLPQICEAKALNGAIRTALHIKGTYTLEEIKRPFVVAYLVPNLNNEDVKEAAIRSMFDASGKLFGTTPSIQHIESKAPENPDMGAQDGEVFDAYVDDTYQEEDYRTEDVMPPEQPVQEEDRRQRQEEWQCCRCGVVIQEKVYDYSNRKFGMPLCYRCQKEEREGRR